MGGRGLDSDRFASAASGEGEDPIPSPVAGEGQGGGEPCERRGSSRIWFSEAAGVSYPVSCARRAVGAAVSLQDEASASQNCRAMPAVPPVRVAFGKIMKDMLVPSGEVGFFSAFSAL
jgi:hypothetical protein